MEKAFGVAHLDALAERLAVPRDIVLASTVYAAPKLVVLLTPNGSLPTTIPDGVRALLGEAAQPRGDGRTAARGTPAWAIWIVLALLALAAGYFAMRHADEPAVAAPAGAIGGTASGIPVATR
jgi:hypothetical protein